MAQKKKTPAGLTQPRFTAGGKLVCAVCWTRNQQQVVLNGDPDELRCYKCGTKYHQKPIGLSFNVVVPDSIVKEAHAASVAAVLKDQEAAKAAREEACVVNEPEPTDNT